MSPQPDPLFYFLLQTEGLQWQCYITTYGCDVAQRNMKLAVGGRPAA